MVFCDHVERRIILNIDYTIEEKACCTLVKTTGTTARPEDIIRYVRTLIADCLERGAEKVLLDHRQLQFDRQYVGSYDVALGALEHLDPAQPFQVALVARPDRMEFIYAYEYIGLGRGLTLKAFEDMAMAMAWLDCGFTDEINELD